MRLGLRGFALGLVLSTAAAAQDDATVAAAREIANQGLEAYDAGRYEEAADKLSRAYEVVKLPTVALLTARALAKAGKLVRASEVYLQATRLEAAGGFRADQEKAQADAARERAELMPRIPSLIVEVEGAEPKDVVATVDGKQVPMALLGAGYVVDPGTRRVEAKVGLVAVTEEVVLKEGERKSVTLRFASQPAAAPLPTAESAPPPNSAPSPSAPPPTPPEADAGAQGSMQATLGWVGLGVGGAGLIFGTVTGVMLASKKSKLDDGGCVKNQCYVDQSDDIDSYNSLRTLSTVGFIVGGVAAAAGATLLLTAPDTEASGPEVQAWLGVGSAGVAGRF